VALTTTATNANSPFTVTATFSEGVSGFTAGDLNLTNAVLSNFSGGPIVYTFDITAIISGAVSVNVPTAIAQDTIGNDNVASNTLSVNKNSSGGGSVPTAPSVSLTTPTNTVEGNFKVTVIFSENVTGFTADDMTLVNASLTNFSVLSGYIYTFDIIPTNDGLVTVNIRAAVARSSNNIDNVSSNTLTVMKTTIPGNNEPIVPVPEDSEIEEPLPAAPEKKWSRTDTFFYEFEDKDIISKLQKLHGADVVTDDAFENVCRTKKQVPYYRQCDFGFDFNTFDQFRNNVICEGFVVDDEQKASRLETPAPRKEAAGIAVKMKKELGKAVPLVLPGNYSYTFADVGQNPNEASWILPITETALKYGIINSNRSTFQPDRTISRGEAYAMIMKSVCMMKESDLVGSNWQKSLHEIAVREDLTIRDWAAFNTSRPILRQELFVLASRASDWAERTGGCDPKPNYCFLNPTE
jgi:hypothetical protein